GVAEVAAAARGGVERERGDGGDCDGGVGQRGKEGARRLERNAERGGVAAEDVGEGVRLEGIGGEEEEERSQNPGDEEGREIGAAGFRNPGDEADGKEHGKDEGGDVGGGEDSEDAREENDAGPPFAFGALERVGHSDGGVDGCEEAGGGPDFV